MKTRHFASLLWIVLPLTAWAGKANIKVHDLDTDEETTISIKKGVPTPAPSLGPEFEILGDTDEIEGEPAAGTQESRKNWKEACAEWKKDMKETHRENQILSLSCGTPKSEVQANGQRIFRSEGKVAFKVRMRSSDGSGATLRKAPAPKAPAELKPTPIPIST